MFTEAEQRENDWLDLEMLNRRVFAVSIVGFGALSNVGNYKSIEEMAQYATNRHKKLRELQQQIIRLQKKLGCEASLISRGE